MKKPLHRTTMLAVIGAVGGWFAGDLIDRGEVERGKRSANSKSDRGPRPARGPSMVDGESQALHVNSATTTTEKLAILTASLVKADVDEIRRRLDGVDQIESSAVRYAALRMLLDRWTQLDPGGALAYATGIEDEDQREIAMALAARWTSTDADAAWEAALAIPNRDRRREAMQSVLLVLSEEDAPRALEFIREHQLQRDFHGMLRVVYKNWASADPEAARAGLEELRSSGSTPYAAAGGYIESFRRKLGTKEALAHFKSTGENWAARDLMRRLVRIDPKGAAQLPEVINARGEPLREFLRAAASKDPDFAVAWTKEHSGPDELATNLSLIATSVAEKQPHLSANLLELIDSLQPPEGQSLLTTKGAERIVNAWMDDPNLALSIVRGLANEEMRGQLHTAFSRRLAAKKPLMFMEQFSQLYEPIPEEDSTLSGREAQRAAKARAAHLSAWKSMVSDAVADFSETGFDPEKNALWLKTLPPELEGAGVHTVFSKWAQIDGPAAAAFFVEQFHDTSAQTNPISNLAAHWSDYDPQAAADWVLGLPESRHREGAVEYLMQRWAGSDPVAASAWLHEQPSSRMREEGAQQLAERIHYQQPAEAVYWASTLSREKDRAKVMGDVLDRWIRRDPAEASAALKAGLTGLSPSETEEWSRRAAAQQQLLQLFR